MCLTWISGWKSVFRVSKTPRVHSRHYHLQFDITADDNLGYVSPMPTSPPPSWDESSGTCILLPLRPDSAQTEKQRQELVVALGELQPSLLLFLHKLRRLTVSLADGQQRTLRRSVDADDPHVVVLESTSVEAGVQSTVAERFLVATHTLAPQAAGIHRLGLERTDSGCICHHWPKRTHVLGVPRLDFSHL